MLTTHDTAKLLALKKRMENLSAADKLRLCAGLLDKGSDEGTLAMVETLAGNVVDQLRAARMFGRPR